MYQTKHSVCGGVFFGYIHESKFQLFIAQANKRLAPSSWAKTNCALALKPKHSPGTEESPEIAWQSFASLDSYFASQEHFSLFISDSHLVALHRRLIDASASQLNPA